LGRYVVSKLAKAGTQVIVPYRDEDTMRHLKVMGDLGQIVPMEWDIRNAALIEQCVRHSDTVYNLVGRDYDTKNFSMDSIHAQGAELIARVSADTGVDKFIHVSHLNANPNSTSRFYRSKFAGEERVREVFPNATIVRPGPMFGYEDRLLNNMAIWPIWWKLNKSETKIRPTHVFDVAQALSNVFNMATLPGTFSLPGPSTLTYEYMLELISSVTYNPPSSAPRVPKAAAKLLAKTSEYVWWPVLSPDEVERRYIDDVSEADVPGDWATFGVQPEEIEPLAITYLRRYRSADNYVRPVVFPSERAGLPTTVSHSRVGL
jgi:NADH dehydrogenase (ubiquinone) 1 alpha subcomplex subunit 9